ncbi:MAG: hypothetical protein ACTSXZ_06200 [Alphaproteobacteria bacterium]
MSGKVSKIGLQIQLDPARGARSLLALFKRHGGMPTAVAAAAGVSHSTVKRWVSRLDLRDQIDEIREELGLKPAGPWAREDPAA